jgi:hypothetical protein
MQIGFIIVSHNAPTQPMRLIDRLNRLYGDPPISCHHDLHQCPIDVASFPSNVSFVKPSVRTS